ncbi:MAG: DUF4252 domain-containing protein [Salinivirgaceae bacterium]
MRTVATLILALVISLLSATGLSAKEYKDFYREYRKADKTISFKIPAGFAAIFIDKDENKEVKEFLKDLDDLSFLIIDQVTNNTLLDLNQSLPEDLYKELMVIHDGDTEITFLVNDNGKFVEELIMTVVEPDELIIMCFTGEITHEHAKQLAKAINVQQASAFRQ